MRNEKGMAFFMIFVFLAGFSGTVDAMLWDCGDGLVYDDVFDITWLQDTNYAGPSGHTDGLDYGTVTDLSTGESFPIPSGHMLWEDAMNWADSLVYGGFDDWRLPITDPAVSGYTISSSELGHMYYVYLGNVAESAGSTPNATFTDVNVGTVSFLNLEPLVYFTGTETEPNEFGSTAAWAFSFKYGYQGPSFPNQYVGSWAVHPGDVASTTAPVPEPATMLLVGAGVVGLAGMRRRLRP